MTRLLAFAVPVLPVALAALAGAVYVAAGRYWRRADRARAVRQAEDVAAVAWGTEGGPGW